MSSNIVFKVPGRTTTYMPIDVNTSKEEILGKYARSSFSSDNSWPEPSPSAGYYDIKNSDTKLILLNNQRTWSHLRGKTKPKKEPFVKDPYYDWVEKEIEMKKQQTEKNLSRIGNYSARKYPDPTRHFNSMSCNYKVDYENEPAVNFRKNNSAQAKIYSQNNLNSDDEKLQNAALLNYLYAIGKQTTGLQDKALDNKPPREYRSSFNLNHPDFNSGQRLYLNNLCQMYSVTPLKQSKQQQYAKLLERQKELDSKRKNKYRMHEGDNFYLYRSYLGSGRPLPHLINCGYFSKTNSYATRPLTSYEPKMYSAYSSEKSSARDFKSSSETGKSESSGERHLEKSKSKNTQNTIDQENNTKSKLNDSSASSDHETLTSSDKKELNSSRDKSRQSDRVKTESTTSIEQQKKESSDETEDEKKIDLYESDDEKKEQNFNNESRNLSSVHTDRSEKKKVNFDESFDDKKNENAKSESAFSDRSDRKKVNFNETSLESNKKKNEESELSKNDNHQKIKKETSSSDSFDEK